MNQEKLLYLLTDTETLITTGNLVTPTRLVGGRASCSGATWQRGILKMDLFCIFCTLFCIMDYFQQIQ